MPKQDESDIIDLGALAGALWRGKWVLGFFVALAIGLGGYYAYVLAVPTYKSTSVVMLETRKSQVVDLQSVMGGLSGDSTEVNSEVEVLRARGLMTKVAKKLDLVADPEFNADLRPEGWITRIKARLGLPGGPVAPPAGEDAKTATLNAVVDALLKATSVRNVPLSLVFQITATTESAVKSADVANTIADVYVLDQLDAKFEATQKAMEWLTKRVAELQDQLESAEGKVKDFTAQTDLVNPETLQALQRQLKELRDRIDSTETASQTAQARLAAMNAAKTRANQAATADDSQLDAFLKRLQAGEDTTIAQAFDTRFSQLLTRARLEAARSKSQLEALKPSRADLADQIERQSNDLITLQQLQREAEADRSLYQYFLGRLKETSAQQGIQQADSRILSQAVVPTLPAAPRKSLILAMSAILGLMLGAGLVLLREARQNTWRTARELERGTGYTVMGQIPLLPTRKRKATLKYLADKPTSATAEAIRNLRTSVLLSNIDRPPQVIVLTSALPSEGKTTLALALAQNLSAMGKKVLLVEGDIRRRVFAHYLEGTGEGRKGILSVLSGDTPLAEAVVHDQLGGADILVGEKTATNAADLFSSDKFAAFLKDARKVYDVIIIDTPPVLVVPDARVIGQQADAILCVVKWDATTKSQVEDALHMFETVNLKVTGLVLSQINPRGMKHYGYGAKYGAYSAYGKKYYTN